MNFLLALYPDLAQVLSEKPSSIGVHKYPFCLLYPWQMGSDFLSNCKSGVFQYVVVRTLLTALSIPGYVMGWYVEGDFSPYSPYFWSIVISCLSQMFALYSLFLFYHALHEEIYVLHPFAKFICIKVVVFFSWFQGVAIGTLVQLGHISGLSEESEQSGHTAQEVADGIQDLLICMEMFLAAIAFYNSFPVSEFSPDVVEKNSLLRRRKSASSMLLNLSCHSNMSPKLASQHPPGLLSDHVDTLQLVRLPSPVVNQSSSVEEGEADEEDQLLMFPEVNRKLDLRKLLDKDRSERE